MHDLTSAYESVLHALSAEETMTPFPVQSSSSHAFCSLISFPHHDDNSAVKSNRVVGADHLVTNMHSYCLVGLGEEWGKMVVD